MGGGRADAAESDARGKDARNDAAAQEEKRRGEEASAQWDSSNQRRQEREQAAAEGAAERSTWPENARRWIEAAAMAFGKSDDET